MKLTLLAVGKMRSKALKEVCDDYLARLKRYGTAEVVEVKAAEGLAPKEATEQECLRILKEINSSDTVWILDERGAQMRSKELSETILKLEINSTKRLVLILGGAYGLNDTVRSKGRLLSFSKMTLPHELCRALALEQLYRARTIQRNEPYHHE
jgi:23S rRNA (pseudouridine1915-N3)-methyltransferase